MDFTRRHILLGSAASIAAATPAFAAPISAIGIDAARYGVKAGSSDDQTTALQRAIDETARVRKPLALSPGQYRVRTLTLPAGAQIAGVPGATTLRSTAAEPLFSARGAEHVILSGLTLDGGGRALPSGRALIMFDAVRQARLTHCTVKNSGGNGVSWIACSGVITECAIDDSADVAIHLMDSAGLTVARNVIVGAGNNGIQVWRSAPSDDATTVLDNRIEAIANKSGGSGQYGNAVNVFRAANVAVRGNRIKNCAFTAVRGNAASGLQVESNSIGDVREVAIYAEFGFEGVVIANNAIDSAAIGVSVTNFNDGGRLAVVSGNMIRNLLPSRPAGTDPGDGAGIGISVEADTAVTGNVIENAPTAGMLLGWGHYLRDVAATGNVVRKADIGIGVSVTPGAGAALIANNLIAETARGAVVGLDRKRIVTGDLALGGAERHANLTLSGNRLR